MLKWSSYLIIGWFWFAEIILRTNLDISVPLLLCNICSDFYYSSWRKAHKERDASAVRVASKDWMKSVPGIAACY